MTGVSLNPANGVIGTNTLQPNDNSLSQLNGLEALLQQPTFTFEGANPALGSRSTEIPRDNIPDWMPNPSLDVNNTNPRGQTIILGSNEGVNGLTKASIGFRFVSPDGKIDVTVVKQNKDGSFVLKDNKTGQTFNFTSVTYPKK